MFSPSIFYEQLKQNALISFRIKLIMNGIIVRLTTSSASREWRSGAMPTNDQTLHEKGNEICNCKKNIRKCMEDFYGNPRECSFNKGYTTRLAFRIPIKWKKITQSLHIKYKVNQFSIVAILIFLSEKGHRIHRMSATCFDTGSCQ